MSRQATVAAASSHAVEAGPSQKRTRPSEMEDDFDDEDEAALLALADAEAATPVSIPAQAESLRRETRKEPELSSGVAAALAKLRQNG
jgi:hypothetical protein